MANKKLKVGGGENLKLPVKKDKTAPKKPKWQAKIGGRNAKGQGSEMGETPQAVESGVVADQPTVPTEPTETARSGDNSGGCGCIANHDGCGSRDA